MPEIFCCFRCHNLEIGPPRGLVAIAMQVEMVISAQWYGEFVADLASERARLGKFQVMRIAGRASADKTRLGSDESKMSLVPAPHFLADRRDHHCGRRLLFSDSPSAYRCVFVLCQSGFSQWPRGVWLILEIAARCLQQGAIGGLYGECIVWRQGILRSNPTVRP